jgi:hypothetical protein
MDLTWGQIVDAVSQLVQQHWVKFIVWGGLLAIGVWWGRWRTYVAWARKEFLGRLNISLNSIEQGTLKIRTLVEKELVEVLLNRHAVEAVQKAAKRTTPENPLLPVTEADKWFLLNGVLNEVSEKFAEGFLRRDMGEPVASGTYLVCLTCECAGEMRTRKVRAMVMRKETLLHLPEEVELESPSHETRVETLRFLSKAYLQKPGDFLEMEICVARGTPAPDRELSQHAVPAAADAQS